MVNRKYNLHLTVAIAWSDFSLSRSPSGLLLACDDVEAELNNQSLLSFNDFADDRTWRRLCSLRYFRSIDFERDFLSLAFWCELELNVTHGICFKRDKNLWRLQLSALNSLSIAVMARRLAKRQLMPWTLGSLWPDWKIPLGTRSKETVSLSSVPVLYPRFLSISCALAFLKQIKKSILLPSCWCLVTQQKDVF